MVHGGGHCSGGGYSGGGGFSATVVSTNYYSSRRSNYYGTGGAPNDCDCTCCKACCLAITCVSLKPKSRIKMTWFLVVVITVITGFSVGFGTYGEHKTDTSASDMRQLTYGLSPRFCSDAKITSSNYPISAFLLPDKPVVNSDNYTTHIYSKFSSVKDDTYEYWGFFLLKNSKVRISACSSQDGIDYYFIKGEHNLNKWKDDNYCSSCYEIHRNTNGCYFGNSTFIHDIIDTDEYYFVFANHLDSSSNIRITFRLDRTSYDLSSAIHTCEKSYECLLTYANEDSDESVVVKLPDADRDNIEVHSACLRRNGIFVALFLIMPLGIGIILSSIIYCACIRKTRKSSTQPYGILQNQPNNNTTGQYSTFNPTAPPNNPRNTPPPAYEARLQPPTYEESMSPEKK